MVNGVSFVLIVVAALLLGFGASPVRDRFSGPLKLSQGVLLVVVALFLLVVGLAMMGGKPLGCP